MRRLLIRPGAIGDFILSLPALESLRSTYTEVWCGSQNVPLAGFADSAQSIVSAGLDRVGLLPADDVIARLQTFDSIISWYGTHNGDFREFVRDLPFQFLPALPGDGDLHAVDFYNNHVRDLTSAAPTRFPEIRCPEAPRSFAVIHPFASNSAKRAPLEVFAGAARRLAARMPAHWLSGPKEDLAGAVRIENLYELACWLRGASIFVGNDSGISHLAAAVGTPVTAFFRDTDPRVWAPRGPSVNIVRISSMGVAI